MRLTLLALAAFAAAMPAVAQDRSVAQREALVGLTRVLGESQALSQACEGPSERRWRDRMERLVDAEQPDEDLAARMTASFNAGLAEGRRIYPACGEGTRRALALAAVRGRDLADALSHVKYRTGIMPVEPEAEQVTAEPSPR
jgi:uncharacterized protein (TIGR02301 family)